MGDSVREVSRQPTLYLPHGGGPCFFMDWTMGPPDTWARMERWLRGLAATLDERPRAVVVVSAHWEESGFVATTGTRPELIYDYYGFPSHTYELRYPAPGDPALAARVQELLSDAGIATAGAHRGFDHGVFVPLLLVLPDADLPVVQLSLNGGLDPAVHLAAGAALAPLRDEGVLLVGSGMSYHNMSGFMTPGAGEVSAAFDAWLTGVCEGPPTERATQLARWADAPFARAAHPREEHLLPLMVCAGAAGGDTGERSFTDVVMAATVSGFRFG